MPWLSVVLLLPLLGAVAIGFSGSPGRARLIALLTSGASFAASVAVLMRFEAGVAGFQLEERLEWVPAWGAGYHVGVDGISLFLILLTTLLTPLVVLASWHHDLRPKGFFASLLVLETAIIGVFVALDLLLFYVFWELMLVPMYLLIGIWGSEHRRYAAVKFFLYTLLGGLLMLAAIVVLYAQTAAAGTASFDYGAVSQLVLDTGLQRWLFLAFFVAFAVKVPLFPMHTWLPDAHTEAPTAGSVILAGVMLKLGGYGLLRFSLPLFPDASRVFVPWIVALSVIGVVYGAVVALMQRDIKRLVAYSSVSHMGFVVLGIFALTTTAATAGVVQMLNHGLSTGALFLLVGFLYERRHTRAIADFSGLAQRVPVYAGLFLVVALSSLALPGLNGFVGEFPILLGTFTVNRWAAIVAATGMVLAALYLLWAYQRMFHGPLEGADNEATRDLDLRERLVIAPLIVLIVAIGIYPRPLFERIEPTVRQLLETVEGRTASSSTGNAP